MKIMKKSYLILAAIASVALASCSSEEYLGEFEGAIHGEKAISFNTGFNAITRGEKTGAEAAAELNNNFIFAGTKSTSTTSSTVFDQYVANFVENTAGTTESNMNNWEYVSYTPAVSTSLPTGATQSIKYWDYSTSQYDFAAFSIGTNAAAKVPESPTAPSANTIQVSAIDLSNKGTENAVYTLTGSAEDLMECYISDLVTAYNRDHINDYGLPVKFSFRSLGTKIRLAFYETVPGYSVKEVQFYNAASGGTATNTPTFFVTTTETFKGLPAGSGKMTVTFPTTGWSNKNDADYNKAHVSFTADDATTLATTKTFDALADLALAEKLEKVMNSDPTPSEVPTYIGRASNAATYAGGIDATTSGKYYTVLPYETGANLQLRIKYTLVSTDGSREEITVDDATAVVPAELAKWQPNFAYTYIFKISDMTNGSTGVDGDGNIITGLTPITLDAVVVDSEDEDAVQETITTVSEPSITTYSEGKVVTVYNEYNAGAPIYIVVNAPVTSGTTTTLTNQVLTAGTNAKLYTIALNYVGTEDENTRPEPINSISEAAVENALAHGGTVKDANDWELTLTDVTASTLIGEQTNIPAADSPTGNQIDVPCAKFTPAVGGKYVFQYLKAAAVPYTEEEAAAYNAALTGHLNSTDALTAEQATAYNATVDKAAGGTLSASEAAAYNATLTGHVEAGDAAPADFVAKVGTPAADDTALTAEEAAAYNAKLDDALNSTDPLDATTAAAYNAKVDKAEGNTLTAAEATAYNATLPGHVSTADIKTPAEYQYKVIIVQ